PLPGGHAPEPVEEASGSVAGSNPLEGSAARRGSPLRGREAEQRALHPLPERGSRGQRASHAGASIKSFANGAGPVGQGAGRTSGGGLGGGRAQGRPLAGQISRGSGCLERGNQEGPPRPGLRLGVERTDRTEAMGAVGARRLFVENQPSCGRSGGLLALVYSVEPGRGGLSHRQERLAPAPRLPSKDP